MKHRLFLAIDVPHDVRASIHALQVKLDHLNIPVRWEPVEKLHLTLNFLGTRDDEELARLKPQLSKAVTAYPEFSLTPAYLETLYTRHEPSLIYLGLAGDIDQLKELRRITTGTVEELRMPQKIRFLPHITIGKMKRTDPVATKSFLDKINDYEFTPLPPFTVNGVTLYESFLSRQGSTYQKVGDHRF